MTTQEVFDAIVENSGNGHIRFLKLPNSYTMSNGSSLLFDLAGSPSNVYYTKVTYTIINGNSYPSSMTTPLEFNSNVYLDMNQSSVDWTTGTRTGYNIYISGIECISIVPRASGRNSFYVYFSPWCSINPNSSTNSVSRAYIWIYYNTNNTISFYNNQGEILSGYAPLILDNVNSPIANPNTLLRTNTYNTSTTYTLTSEPVTITPDYDIDTTTMKINGRAFTAPTSISQDSTISADAIPPTLTPQITNAELLLNGKPFTAATQIGPYSTLVATGKPALLTATAGDDVTLKLNGSKITSGTQQSLTGTNTLSAENTKPDSVLTFTFDEKVSVTLNELNVTSGQPYPIEGNAAINISGGVADVELSVMYTNQNSVTLDGTAVENGTMVKLSEGSHTLAATGSIAIPEVMINGEGITQFSVNGNDFQPSSLPYKFTPMGGMTNSIYVSGENTTAKTITISGTHIASITVNNEEVTLPYTTTVSEPLDISVSGEVYQVDVSSKGGAIVKQGETILSNGEKIHTIIDVTKDTFLSIDGTHTLTVTGEELKTITINGVSVDVSQLPVTINNNAMTATVVVGGYPPSEIHVVGTYIDTATLDGNAVTIGANGSIDLEVEVREENHFLSIIGSQPRNFALTFENNGVTDIELNGQTVPNGTQMISGNSFIEAEAKPIPVNFDTDGFIMVQVNGVPYTGDFAVNVSKETFVDVTANSCNLIIDYGDNSYSITVPQSMITLTAPHRDGWIFDTWTSNDTGIINPRAVQCNIDLTGKMTAHLVANYQRFMTCDKPNRWN